MVVKNINGTSDNNCNCGSWLNHWQNFSGKPAIFCTVDNCQNTDVVGAHVQLDSNDQSWYIVPLCKFHNASKMALSVSSDTTVVSANRALTCEK